MSGRFSLVPFGAAAPPGAVTCDGLVEGARLDLTHWRGNRTPPSLKRDTSVEIALAFARDASPADTAHVVNNHFDTDGVLAVWTLLSPHRAAEHAGLVVAAAEAGDFDEWPSDERGLRLDAAIAAMARGLDERAAYERVLGALDDLVEHLDARDDLWGAAWSDLSAARSRARAGALGVESLGPIAILHHEPGLAELPGPVLHQAAPAGATRWLLAFEEADGRFRYRYEMPRHAWADTVRRPTLTSPAKNALIADLGSGWAIKGGLGMTGLLRSTTPVPMPPAEVASRLRARDRWA